jgi:hypothetical protein
MTPLLLGNQQHFIKEMTGGKFALEKFPFPVWGVNGQRVTEHLNPAVFHRDGLALFKE